MSIWPKRRRMIVVGLAALVVGSVSFALAATSTATREASARTAPTVVRARSGHGRAALLRGAVRFRTLAHKLILRRNAALHGRHLSVAAGPDPLALAAIRDMAIEIASLNGDANPQDGQLFSSTRKLAESVISGDIVDTDQPVYVAVFHGNFVGYMASVPNSGEFPVGNAMTVVFDANTLDVTDWGLVPNAPDTTRLGPSTSLGF
jgi:hypothetical protein